MKNTLLLTFLLLICSCITPGKVSSYLEKPKNKPEADVIVQQYLSANELLAVAFCARTYPVKESTDTNTETIPGNSEELKNKLAQAEAEADSLLQVLNMEPVKDDCKPEAAARDKIIRTLQSRIARLNAMAMDLKADVQKTTMVKTQENTAKVRELTMVLQSQKDSTAKYQARLQVTQEDYASVKSRLTRAYWFGAILVIAVAGLLFLLFRR